MKDQENIIARARRGDAGAFEQLVETYRDQVYRIALRMCGNAADADEAAQEAFLAAWKGLPNFRGDSQFSTWLYQLTTHAAIDLMRREKRQIAAAEIPSGTLKDAMTSMQPQPSTRQAAKHQSLSSRSIRPSALV